MIPKILLVFLINSLNSIVFAAPAAPTVTTGSPSGTCQQYHSSTSVSNNTGTVEIDYEFTAGVALHVTGYFTSPKSNGQVESYGAQVFAQICE